MFRRLLAALALLAATPSFAAEPTVILISFDGTRPAAVEKLPGFARIEAEGAWADSLRPSFPANTFPNHVTLVTGVSPDRHGIVNNGFYDPARGLFNYVAGVMRWSLRVAAYTALLVTDAYPPFSVE